MPERPESAPPNPSTASEAFSVSGPYRYRADVIDHLWRHGIHPTSDTPPQLVRDCVRDLYKYEIRCLRQRMVNEEFPRAEYSDRVDALRRRYPVLALLPNQFLIP